MHPIAHTYMYHKICRRLILFIHSFFTMNIQVLLSTSCCVVIVVSTFANAQSMGNVPVEVNRTLQADSYRLYRDNTSLVCAEGNTSTYMVADRECINNQELFRGNKYSTHTHTMATIWHTIIIIIILVTQ